MLRGTLPEPTPETAWFWEGTRLGELRLQRCDQCGQHVFPLSAVCPTCYGRDLSIVASSGRARLYSYVINHMVAAGTEPYAIAVVELAEGPRLMTNIVECPQTPGALALDMALEVVFERASDSITLPKFRPIRVAND